MADADRGWICPRCDVVHAPCVMRCDCSPDPVATEKSNDPLRKYAEFAEQLKRYQPIYVPYAVPYEQPRPPTYWWLESPYGQTTQEIVTTTGSLPKFTVRSS